MTAPIEVLALRGVSFHYPAVSAKALSLKNHLLSQLVLRRKSEYRTLNRPAIANVSLSLRRGQRLAIIGGNGAGKTTLLRLAAGHLSPSIGDVRLAPSTLALLGDRAVGLDHELTGSENISLLLRAHGLSRNLLRKAYESVMFLFGMPDRINDQISTYSSGMKVRLQTSIMLNCPGSVLICDELLGMADLEFQHKARSVLQARLLGAESLMIATHSRQVARQFCNEALWLRMGHMVASGALDQVWDQYEQFSKRQADE